MADLKLTNVSMVSDLGTYEGNVLGLVLYLRSQAISDLIKLLDRQLIYDNLSESSLSEESEEEILVENEEDTFGDVLSPKESEEIFEVGVPVEAIPQKPSEILDTAITTKIDKFKGVIKYFDDIIVLDGVVADTITSNTIIQKFKELEGVYTYYGEFTLSGSLNVV